MKGTHTNDFYDGGTFGHFLKKCVKTVKSRLLLSNRESSGCPLYTTNKKTEDFCEETTKSAKRRG